MKRWMESRRRSGPQTPHLIALCGMRNQQLFPYFPSLQSSSLLSVTLKGCDRVIENGEHQVRKELREAS